LDAWKDYDILLVGTRRAVGGRHSLVSVGDSGIGLPVEGAERIFEAFFTTEPDGTGIGLPLSRRIIGSHGGRLWASANTPRGAVVHFTVPITPGVTS
jgi:signal transduction histidine kinase